MNLALKNDFKNLSENLRSRRILITGASGFVGSNLIEILSCLNKAYDLDLKLFGLSRSKHANTDTTTWLSHDIATNLNFKLEVDDIIHAATPVDLNSEPKSLFHTIVSGTKNILEFANNNACQNFLNISSGAVYGEMPLDKTGFSEDQSPGLVHFDEKLAYGSGKRAAEALLQEFAKHSDLKITNARGFAFSGRHLPLGKHFAIGNFVGNVIRGEDILVKGDGQALRSYLDAEDMVYWFLNILYKAKNLETYNVGSDQTISIALLAQTIAKMGTKSTVKIENTLKSDKVNRYFPDITKAKNELGLGVQISLSESIQRMFDFQKELKK